MVKGKELEDLLPQSKPILMIDALISSNESFAETHFYIDPKNILVRKGKFTEAGIIENIAQTAAAHSGWLSKNNNTPVRTGFIASVKKLKIHFLPSTAKKILTKIQIKTVVEDITVISAEAKLDNRILAECEMTIILTDFSKNS